MDTYYQLLDRDTSTITSSWKVVHIVSFVIIIVSGFISAYTFGRSIDAFGENCVLFAKLVFVENDTTSSRKLFQPRALPTGLKPIDLTASEWGSMDLCYFCQFTPLVSMIFSIIWGTFFLMCAKGGAGYITDTIYRPWRIVYPALIFTAISTCLMLFSTMQLNAGVDSFCTQFKSVFNTTSCIIDIDDYTLSFHNHRRRCVVILKVAVSFSYICFLGWMLQLATLILRIICIADFQLIRITVTSKDEEVVAVVNADEIGSDKFSSVSEKRSVDSSISGPPHGHKKKFSLFSRGQKHAKSSKPTTSTVAPKLAETPAAHENSPRHSGHRVSFADEVPNAQEGIRVAPNHSADQNNEAERMSLAELKSYIAGQVNGTETTSFSPTEENCKTPIASSPLVQISGKAALHGALSSQSSVAGRSNPASELATSDEIKNQNTDKHHAVIDASVQANHSRVVVTQISLL